jgi:hypothetical protein
MSESSIQHITVLSATAEGSVLKLLCLCNGSQLLLLHVSNSNLPPVMHTTTRTRGTSASLQSQGPQTHTMLAKPFECKASGGNTIYERRQAFANKVLCEHGQMLMETGL